MTRKEKGLLSLLLVGMLSAVAGFGIFGAFTSTTSNANNEFDAGTVVIADNDSSTAMYDVTDQAPGGAAVQRCIDVTYTGSLAADVKLYANSATVGDLGPYVNLTVEPGTQLTPAFPSCTGFVADAGGPLYSGTLAAFASAHNSYATGVSDFPGVTSSWSQNDHVVYRFTVQLDSAAPDSAQGDTTGLHGYTWEARNQ